MEFISSRKRTPPSASWNKPLASLAPVYAPFLVPNNMDSKRVSGIAAQFCAMNFDLSIKLLLTIALTKSSLPVPVSPYIRTGLSYSEKIFAFLMLSFIEEFTVIISLNVISSSVFKFDCFMSLSPETLEIPAFSIEVISCDNSTAPTTSPLFIMGMVTLFVLKTLPFMSILT